MKGQFAGGLEAPVGMGKLESISLGSVTVRRLPVAIVDLAALGPELGRRIDGILGTEVLYHFVSTLDYPDHRLVLHRRTGAGETCTGKTVPFVLAGSHSPLARGSIGSVRDQVWVVDTGLSGGGFYAPEETFARRVSCSIARRFSVASAAAARSWRSHSGYPSCPWGPSSHATSRASSRRVPSSSRGCSGCESTASCQQGFLAPYAVTFDFDAMRMCLR